VGALAALSIVAWIAMLALHGMAPGAMQLVLVWTAMTVGMMTPSAVPMAVTYLRIAPRLEPTLNRAICLAAFIAAYLVVWILFAACAAALQLGMRGFFLIDEHMRFTSSSVGGVFLIAAGLYQLTPLKRVCISKCRLPLGFLLGSYRPGYRGAFEIGLLHGAYCIGCCWLLMALVWVGGMMNLTWMALLSVLVIAEKTLPDAEWLVKATGLGLIVFGLTILLLPGNDLLLTLDTLASLCRR
jgi:predicted metal-binding membrane protein